MNIHEQSPSNLVKPEDASGSHELNQKEQLIQNLQEYSSQFVAGNIVDGKEIVHEGDKSVIYRCLETDISLPGIEKAKFRLDYRKYRASTERGFAQLRFEYTLPDKSGNQAPFAEMHLGVANESMFVLVHRYVKPEYRDKRGIGSNLLNVAEEWVQQVANKRNQQITVVLCVGQEDVMKWAEKRGYAVVEDDKGLSDELREHPERFVKDHVILSEESAQAGVEKSPYTFRKEQEGRYMEDAIRLNFEKKFDPKS